MAYSPAQMKVARTIISVGKANGATNREIISALETGLMESSLNAKAQNKWGFVGWRQEHPKYYGKYDRTNPRGQAQRYFKEARAVRGQGLASHQIAAAVQRPEPSARGMYRNFARQARSLFSQLQGAGGPGAVAAAAADSVRTTVRPGVLSTDSGAAIRDALLEGGQNPILRAAGLVDSGAYTSRSPDTTVTTRKPSREPGSTGGGAFDAKLGGGADRPGMKTKPVVIEFVGRIADMMNEDLLIGTGTRHSRMTVNNNVSAHWTGDAADVPMRGRKLIRAGQAALIAAGADPSWARKQRGGLFNVGGWQVIFNTQEGGDHTDHLHVGRRRRR